MPINHSLRVIFIHIPKTAGTSIEYALGMHGKYEGLGIKKYSIYEPNIETLFGRKLQHLTARQIKVMIGDDIFHSYYKFSVVRNPYERLVSYVAWVGGKWERNEILTRELFQDYIKQNFLFKTISFNKFLIPQYNFLYIRQKPVIDILLRFENIENDFYILKEKLGVNVELQKRMISQHLDFKYYYGKKEIRVVNSYYKNDFKYFGYRLHN